MPDAAATVVLVHPDDVNLADAKALAAQHDATMEGSRYVPRGQMFLTRATRVLPPRVSNQDAGGGDDRG